MNKIKKINSENQFIVAKKNVADSDTNQWMSYTEATETCIELHFLINLTACVFFLFSFYVSYSYGIAIVFWHRHRCSVYHSIIDNIVAFNSIDFLPPPNRRTKSVRRLIELEKAAWRLCLRSKLDFRVNNCHVLMLLICVCARMVSLTPFDRCANNIYVHFLLAPFAVDWMCVFVCRARTSNNCHRRQTMP